MPIPTRYLSPNFPKNETLKGFVFAGANIKARQGKGGLFLSFPATDNREITENTTGAPDRRRLISRRAAGRGGRRGARVARVHAEPGPGGLRTPRRFSRPPQVHRSKNDRRFHHSAASASDFCGTPAPAGTPAPSGGEPSPRAPPAETVRWNAAEGPAAPGVDRPTA